MTVKSDRIVDYVDEPPSNLLNDADLYPSGIKSPPAWNVLKEHLRLQGRVEKSTVIGLIKRASTIFSNEPNVLMLDDPINIIGDIHGQFYDLLNIIKLIGCPSENKYLFLGDYLDRGSFSVEVLLLLYSLKINYPDTFLMLRGNHECRQMTTFFNFKKECIVKYDLDVYDEFILSFENLPIAAVINKRYFALHGGISPELSYIEHINFINRKIEPPIQGILCDLLWADPYNNTNHKPEINRQESNVHFYQRTSPHTPDQSHLHKTQSNSFTTPLEVQSTSSSPAESSSNYLPVNGNATPGDRGDDRGEEYKTSSGSGKPENDLREFEGELNRKASTASGKTSSGEADGRTYGGGEWKSEDIDISRVYDNHIDNDNSSCIETCGGCITSTTIGNGMNMLFNNGLSSNKFLPNRLRGCSWTYGYDVVDEFLIKNKLLCIIRGHEAQLDGYKMQFYDLKTKFPKVITIFSAPNYCDVYNNKGAILKIFNNTLNIQQFHSVKHPYYLPNFMDIFTWSIPFISEKILEILNLLLGDNKQITSINNIKLPNHIEKLIKNTNKSYTIPISRSDTIRKKVKMIGMFMNTYKNIRIKNELILKLNNCTPAPKIPFEDIILQNQQHFTNEEKFNSSLSIDSINERRPNTPLNTNQI